VIFCRLLFGKFTKWLAYSKCACLNALYYPLLSRFSTSEFFRAKRPFSFVGIPFCSPRKPSKLRSAKKGRSKSDLARHVSAFLKICFTSWSTSNHAFTKSGYNWNVTSSRKIRKLKPNFNSRRAKFDRQTPNIYTQYPSIFKWVCSVNDSNECVQSIFKKVCSYFGWIKVGKNLLTLECRPRFRGLILPRLADVIRDTDKGKGRFVRKNSLVENRRLYCLFYRTV
jgi:hypothetical protein